MHCSIGRGYELCAAYRQQGFDATIEACIHYLVLSEEDGVAPLRGFAKINPPIRARAEREALWRHLAAGNVTIVSTDHVSWSCDRKDNPDMLNNASGAPGLEAPNPLLLGELERRGLSFSFAARLLAENPARRFRLFEKGALGVGRRADVAVMRRAPHVYEAAASGRNFVDWSPYDGLALSWRAIIDAIRETTGGKIIGEGKATKNRVVYTNEAFAIGSVVVGAGAKALRLHVMNEYVAVEDADGRRVATFPNVIATLRADGEPLSVGQLQEGAKVIVLHVAKRLLPLFSSVLDPSVYPPVERAMGVEIARYALAGAAR